jgi:hypothetical protein
MRGASTADGVGLALLPYSFELDLPDATGPIFPGRTATVATAYEAPDDPTVEVTIQVQGPYPAEFGETGYGYPVSQYFVTGVPAN